MLTSGRALRRDVRGIDLRLTMLASSILIVLPTLLLITGLSTRREFNREHGLRAQIQQAYEYRTALRSVLVDLQDAETGQRGYLLTRRPNYLEPYRKARVKIGADLRTLRRAHPRESAGVADRLSATTARKLDELGRTIRLAQAGRRADALRLVETDVGQREMDAARQLVERERDRTLALVTNWNQLADASAHATVRNAFIVLSVVLLALVGASALVSYILVQRRRVNTRLAELLDISSVAERTSQSGHWVWSLASGRRRWSPGLFSVFGVPVTSEPPLAQAVIDMYAEPDRQTLQAELSRAVETQSGFDLEAEITDARGERKFVRLKVEHVGSGADAKLIGAVQDTTSMRTSQLALAASEERFRHLADSSTDMMATLAIDSTIQYVSPAARRILGYAPEELIGRKTLGLTHPEDVPAVLAVFDGLRRAGPVDTTLAYRFRGRHKDGAWVWLEGQPRVEFDADGTPVRYQDVVREIGSRKAAEEALEASRAMAIESERRYRLLAENATDMIARYGLDGVISYVSPACRKVLGYDPADLVGRSTLSLVYPEDLDRIRTQFAAFRASGLVDAIHTEHRVERRDGTVIWLEGRPKLTFDEAGEPLEYQDVMRDVTVRKAMEDELRDARRAAEEAARAKADFLANMSHELRTPLNSIVGFAGLIADAEELSDETRRRVGIVRDASRTLVEIVNDVLDFSKFEAEGISLVPEPTNLTALLSSVLELMQQAARAKGIRLETRLVVDPGTVLIDATRLRQVVLNLVGNAIKFTEQGVVTLGLDEEGDGRLRLTVRDTGIGIPADRITSIFGRFAQADASTSRRFGGTGLGLAICRSIVEAMGGEIGVDSEEGVGSTFSVRLSPPRLSEAMHVEAPAPSDAASPGARRLAGLRILVADDNIFNRELFELLMAGQGWEITSACDGGEAVALARTQPFDLIFMDMQMPVMDGLEATRAIRSLGLVDIPIVALSANVVPTQIAIGRAAGMSDHLGKPYTAEAALEMVAKWTLDREPQATSMLPRLVAS